MAEQVILGIPTAPGIVIGDCFLFRHSEPEFTEYCIIESERVHEITRFHNAVKTTERQLKALREQIARQVGETVARIFDAQALILEDVEFIGAIENGIKNDGLNAESVTQNIARRYHDSFVALEDSKFREQAQDICDVSRRLIRNLVGSSVSSVGPLDRPAILVTDDLVPSDVIHLMRENVLAVVADLGSAASHTAILTRSLEVPSVVGLKDISNKVKNGDRIVVNGNSGKVIIHPAGSTVRSYRLKIQRYEKYRESLKDIEKLPAETTDGHRVILRVNIELAQELSAVISKGGEGVGLFRTEYLILSRNHLPSEDEQYEEYRKVIERIAPHPVTIRTFDLGGDKMFANLPMPVEANPFMGWRAIRVSLDQPAMLRNQLRAILRASASGQARVMFPLLSGLGELRQIKAHYEDIIGELKKEGLPFGENLKLGVMIELPAAAIMADKIAREVDFFSIGTNDLTQFTLAVDRGNDQVKGLYQPLHPAMIRLIKMTVDAGHQNGIETAMCGEMAANPVATMLLVGLGLDELSVSPIALPEVKKLIRSMSYEEAKQMVQHALTLDTSEELIDYCRNMMKHRFADLPIWFNG